MSVHTAAVRQLKFLEPASRVEWDILCVVGYSASGLAVGRRSRRYKMQTLAARLQRAAGLRLGWPYVSARVVAAARAGM